MCQSHVFFAYSKEAEQDKNFPEFRQKLESTVWRAGFFGKALAYTPYPTAFVLAVLGIVGTTVAPASSIIHILNIAIPSLSTAIMGASKVAKDSYTKASDKLIEEGLELKFFELKPNIDTIDVEAGEQKSIEHDAIKYRLLGT